MRLSIFSRELLLAVMLIGLGAYLVVPWGEGGPEDVSGRPTLKGHENLVEEVLFTPDGRTLLSSGWDRYVRVWNLENDEAGWGKEVNDLENDWHVFGIATTTDGKYLAAAGVGGFALWRRSAQSGWELVAEELGQGRRSVAASPDCRTLALGGLDQTVRLWDIPTRKETQVLTGLTDDVRAVQFSPDGQFVAGSTFSGEFQIWKLMPGEQALPIKSRVERVQAFCFTSDDRTLALARWGDDSKDLILWDYRNGKEVMHLAANACGINDLAVSPDGRMLASAHRDRSIRFWDMRTGQLMATIAEGVGWVKTLAYAPDGRRIAFGGQSGAVQFLKLDKQSMPEGAGRSVKLG